METNYQKQTQIGTTQMSNELISVLEINRLLAFVEISEELKFRYYYISASFLSIYTQVLLTYVKNLKYTR